MNLAHLRAFVWLRYRLLVNQISRGGIVNKVILAIVVAASSLSVIVVTLTSFLVGWLAMGELSSMVLMFIWDGIVLFLFFTWSIGVLSELQRAEALSIEKFLHLPVSIAGVFGLNYLSSLVSINLLIFLPIMIGFSMGLVLSRGPALLLVLPLVLSHLLMLTALTYQFQGWLASLMVDQRRRRTVIMVVTVVFILISQMPTLINVLRPWEITKDSISERSAAEQIENRRALNAGEIGQDEFQKRQSKVVAERRTEMARSNQRTLEQVDIYATMFNTILPIGWLPLGVRGAIDGNALPALFGTLGYTLIGAASLWRAYRTTLRLYTGQFSKGERKAEIPSPLPPPLEGGEVPTDTLLDRRLPWISEHASIIALAGFRSLSRAPEAKMLLLTPFILAVVFAATFFRIPADFPEYARPLMAFGGITLILISMTQLVGNQFGFDRAGFRVFVLSPAPRREIFLGKNLAVAPIALTLCIVSVCFVQMLLPMRIDHFLAFFPQLISMYLLFCMLANFLSMYAPMAIAAGTMKPASTKLIPVLLSMLFMAAFTLVMGATFLPLGLEAALDALGWVQGVPLTLILSSVGCVAVIALYRYVLGWQGTLLQAREQAILEIVTTKAE